MLNHMEKIKGRDLRLSGVVTEVEHKVTKTGKPFGVLYLEDYHSSFSFYLFGDDYINFKAYLTEGWLLYLSGKVKKKFYNDDLEFKIASIDLLAELVDKEVRDIVLRVDVNDISADLVEELSTLISKSSGKHSLVLSVIDSLNQYEVDLLSRKAKVNLDKDFLTHMNTINQVKMSIK